MPERKVSLDVSLKGDISRSKWSELSPIVHSLLSKLGEAGLANTLDVRISVDHNKRKPSIRPTSEFDIPSEIDFEALPIEDEELQASAQAAGEYIKDRREGLELTQVEVTKRMGDGGAHGWLSNLERNTMTGKRPLAPKLYLLARALNIDPAELLARYGYKIINVED